MNIEWRNTVLTCDKKTLEIEKTEDDATIELKERFSRCGLASAFIGILILRLAG